MTLITYIMILLIAIDIFIVSNGFSCSFVK